MKKVEKIATYLLLIIAAAGMILLACLSDSFWGIPY